MAAQNGMWCFKNDLLGSSGVAHLQTLVSKGIFNVYVNVGFPSPGQGTPRFPELSGFVPASEIGIIVSQSEVNTMKAKMAQVDSRLKLWAWFGSYSTAGSDDASGHNLARISVNTAAKRSAVVNACLSIMSYGFYGAQDDTEDFQADSLESNGQFGTVTNAYFNHFASTFKAAGYPVHSFIPSGWYAYNSNFVQQLTEPSAIILAGHGHNGSMSAELWRQLTQLFFQNARAPILFNFGYSSIIDAQVNGLRNYPLSAVQDKIAGYTFYEIGFWNNNWSIWDNWPHKGTSPSPAPAPGPAPTSPSPPPPPPAPSLTSTRENYMLQSELFDGVNGNMTIATGQAGGPSFISNWNKITAGSTHTGGATKFCNVPNGEFVASVHLKADSVNYAVVKVQPNTYNKAAFCWINLIDGTTTLNSVNMPSLVTVQANEVEDGIWRLAIKTSLSEGIPIGMEISPVSAANVYTSSLSQSIFASGIQFERGAIVTYYKPATTEIEYRNIDEITLSAPSLTLGEGSTSQVTVTAVDNEGAPWDYYTIPVTTSNSSILSFSTANAVTDADGTATIDLAAIAAGSATASASVPTVPVITSNVLSFTVISTAPSTIGVSKTLENFSQVFTVVNIDEPDEELPAIELSVSQGIVDFLQSVTGATIDISGPVAAPTLIVGQSGVSPIALVGTGVVGANITLFVNGSPDADSITVDADGVWSTTLDLEEGSYTIYAYQEYEGELSSISNIETTTILAVGGGGNRFRSGSGTGPRKAIRPTKVPKNTSWPTK
jgi:hypothetical protein